jgi:hypothetical protein
VLKDSYVRVKTLKEAGLKPGKPKGELTEEDLSHDGLRSFASCPEFKAAHNYWGNEWVVKYKDQGPVSDALSDTLQYQRSELLRDVEQLPRLQGVEGPVNLRTPSTLPRSASDPSLGVGERFRANKKEVTDFFKFMKKEVKTAEKVKKAFLKQVEKCEKKELKRETLVGQINTVKTQIDADLANADEFARQNKLFAIKYLFGSKLGAQAPPEKVTIVVEISDKIAPFMENIKNDILAFFATVIEKKDDPHDLEAKPNVENFDLIFFSSAGITSYCQVNKMGKYAPEKVHEENKKKELPPLTSAFVATQFPTDGPEARKEWKKKGAADCQKWFQKQFTPKAGAAAPWPPDWLAMVEKLVEDEENLPSAVFVACSKAPMPLRDPLNRMNDVRTLKDLPLPMEVVSYDPEVEGDFNQEEFFAELVGPEGHFQVDTSKQGMEMVDKTLADVKKKKKQFDKFNKKLGKMEDMSDKLKDFKGLLYKQISIENLLRNDWILHEQALKQPAA